MTHRWRCGVTGIVTGLVAVSVAACGSTGSSAKSQSGRRAELSAEREWRIDDSAEAGGRSH